MILVKKTSRNTFEMTSKIFIPILYAISMILVLGCKKEPSIVLPILTTSPVVNISSSSFDCGGEIKSDGGEALIALGVCWSINQLPSISDNKTVDGIVSGSFTSKISGLNPGTTYYIRAYASNSVGTSYGNQVITFTNSTLPTINTTVMSGVTSTTAVSGGDIKNNGGSSIITRGVCWSKSQNPTILDSKTSDGTGIGIYNSFITGLTPGSIYYIRSYATNSIGTTYGNQLNFKATPVLSTITTSAVNSISTGSALSGGIITSDGGSDVTERGVCWGTTMNPTVNDSKSTNGNGMGPYECNITGLASGINYYLRAYAINSQGVAYGNEMSFRTKVDGTMGTLIDIDGNVYSTVSVGSQVWMTENLKVTRFNDGSSIPKVSDNQAWTQLQSPGFCWYNNDELTNKDSFGALYNWYSVNTGKLCPNGWHVPTDAQWTTLSSYLGDLSVVGGKLKQTGTLNWNSPNLGATNEIKFSALPGGYRTYNYNGAFFSLGIGGSWWSITSFSSTSAWERAVTNNSAALTVISAEKGYGVSVRCVKD